MFPLVPVDAELASKAIHAFGQDAGLLLEHVYFVVPPLCICYVLALRTMLDVGSWSEHTTKAKECSQQKPKLPLKVSSSHLRRWQAGTAPANDALDTMLMGCRND